MAAAGHQPGRYIVLRLTDGRVRAYALLDESCSPLEMVGQIRNESGPLNSAFLLGSTGGPEAVSLFVEDLLNRRRLALTAELHPGESTSILHTLPGARWELGPA